MRTNANELSATRCDQPESLHLVLRGAAETGLRPRSRLKANWRRAYSCIRGSKSYAQATGWVGVLIGAVIMLKNIDDPAAIGPAAALMLLTALYGTIIAYFVCLPISSKLQVHLDDLNKTS